jgi:hypothetical protein
MQKTKADLIERMTETPDDPLVAAAIARLSNQEISLKALVDDFQAYKMSAEFDILVPKDVSKFKIVRIFFLGFLVLYLGVQYVVYQACIYWKYFRKVC